VSFLGVSFPGVSWGFVREGKKKSLLFIQLMVEVAGVLLQHTGRPFA